MMRLPSTSQARRLTDSPQPSFRRIDPRNFTTSDSSLSAGKLPPLQLDAAPTAPEGDGINFWNELRSSLVELLLSLLWVYGSLASSVAAHWACSPVCLLKHKNFEPSGAWNDEMALSSPMDASTTPSMNTMPANDHGSPMCPSAAAPMVTSIASGFLAAVACGLTTGLARHGNESSSSSGGGSENGVGSGSGRLSVGGSEGAKRWAGGHPRHPPHSSLVDDEGVEINTRGGFHPTVALALALRGRLQPPRLAMYIAAQLLGACLAGLLIELTVGLECHVDVLKTVHRHVMGDRVGAVLLQAVLNLVLALIYLWTDRRNHLMAFPIVVGFHYAASFLVGLPMLGLPVLNPTRAFGVAATLFAHRKSDHLPTIWQDLTAGWAGALLGVVLAVGVDVLLFAHFLWGAAVKPSRSASPAATASRGHNAILL